MIVVVTNITFIALSRTVVSICSNPSIILDGKMNYGKSKQYICLIFSGPMLARKTSSRVKDIDF